MGKKQHNFVIINGKKYSADTGEMLHNDVMSEKSEKSISSVTEVARLTQQRPTDLRSAPQQIDRHPNHTDLSPKSTPVKATKMFDPLSHKATVSTNTARPKSIKVQSSATGIHGKAKKVQAAEQQRVKQPDLPKISSLTAAQVSRDPTSSKQPRIDLGYSHQQARRVRAAQHQKHNQISKFAAARRAVDEKSNDVAPLQVADLPTPVAEEQPKLRIPAMKPPQKTASFEQKKALSHAALRASVNERHPRTKTKPVQDKTKQDQEIAEPKRSFWKSFTIKQNFVPIAAASMSVLLIVGYVTYLNIPNFAMRVAASRSGFDATLPAYTPDGFSFDGPVAYNSGQVTVDFKSNTDDSTYEVVQRQSRWDSQALQENIVTEESDSYLTFEDKGLTIYVYNGTSATWVNKGIWYTIDGDTKLNTEQLLKIATSL